MSTRARTWTAIALPPLIWFVFEQGLSALLHADCSRWKTGLLWGVASLIACALTLRLTWSLRTYEGTLSHPWLARQAPALTGVFSIAIAFQTLAIALVPTCVG